MVDTQAAPEKAKEPQEKQGERPATLLDITIENAQAVDALSSGMSFSEAEKDQARKEAFQQAEKNGSLASFEYFEALDNIALNRHQAQKTQPQNLDISKEELADIADAILTEDPSARIPLAKDGEAELKKVSWQSVDNEKTEQGKEAAREQEEYQTHADHLRNFKMYLRDEVTEGEYKSFLARENEAMASPGKEIYNFEREKALKETIKQRFRDAYFTAEGKQTVMDYTYHEVNNRHITPENRTYLFNDRMETLEDNALNLHMEALENNGRVVVQTRAGTFRANYEHLLSTRSIPDGRGKGICDVEALSDPEKLKKKLSQLETTTAVTDPWQYPPPAQKGEVKADREPGPLRPSRKEEELEKPKQPLDPDRIERAKAIQKSFENID